MSSSDSDSILWSMLFGGGIKIVGIYQGLTSDRYRSAVDKLAFAPEDLAWVAAVAAEDHFVLRMLVKTTALYPIVS